MEFLKEKINDILEEWEQSDFMEKIFYILIGCTFILLITVFWLLYMQITGIHEGYVYKKKYVSPYVTFISVSNVLIPQYHSESYNIYISKEKTEIVDPNWCEIPSIYFKDIKVGQYIDCNDLDR